MIEDYLSSRSTNNVLILNRLLHDIDSTFLQHKRSLKEFDLSQIAEDCQDLSSKSGLIEDELSLPIPLDDLNAASKLNPGQLQAFNTIKHAIMRKQSQTFFIDDRGDRAAAIIWDEAPMADRKAIETVDQTLREIFGIDLPFGGKIMILGGDFCQVVPVVVGGTRSQAVKSSIMELHLWSSIKVLHLADNIRAQNDQSFSDFLLRIDLGSHTYDPEYMMDRALITPLNDDVSMLNERVLQAFTGEEEVTYYSFDSVSDDMNNLYLPEFPNSLTLGNLPPHKLTLKKRGPIMLLRNINPKIRLCNGTRLIYRKFGRNIVDAEILTGQFKGTRVFLPCIPLKTSEDAKMPFEMIRRQFPVRLSFATDN
ncbi:UNVERIFIED_CONTAM: hypothetical protein Sradi_5737300 [Sesamum radiatum]|uniref:ATP-dependent DNA helicase n=1 Tax=Sesamum radiatum TaxID=300843 RepID=A0AAW2L298_SESRA